MLPLALTWTLIVGDYSPVALRWRGSLLFWALVFHHYDDILSSFGFGLLGGALCAHDLSATQDQEASSSLGAQCDTCPPSGRALGTSHEVTADDVFPHR